MYDGREDDEVDIDMGIMDDVDVDDICPAYSWLAELDTECECECGWYPKWCGRCRWW